MEEKKISVVLPVYNGAKYLAESIESVINQTYTNWELIIVNDCSTDESLDIALNYATKDARIKVFTNKENLKLPNSLNAGFECAEGVYYTWTSDDNRYKSDAFRIMVETLEKNPDTEMVYADYICVDSAGNALRQVRLPGPEYMFTRNIIGACFLYTADVAKKVGKYDAELFLAEDYDFWIRLYKLGKIKHINSDLYFYRIHEKSLSETKKRSVRNQTFNMLEKHFLFAYAKSMECKLQNEFFDQVLECAMDRYDETLNKILLMEKNYKKHLRWKKMQMHVWNSQWWRVLEKICKIVKSTYRFNSKD